MNAGENKEEQKKSGEVNPYEEEKRLMEKGTRIDIGDGVRMYQCKKDTVDKSVLYSVRIHIYLMTDIVSASL